MTRQPFRVYSRNVNLDEKDRLKRTFLEIKQCMSSRSHRHIIIIIIPSKSHK
ncbi:hypothetical protein HanIR_Chr04g0152141 [Helianthus annuus]|nr:hypothetical protein HanIR_Chr04g0152141 [Helianthus annuus]